jgi:signal transduction histidine kinase
MIKLLSLIEDMSFELNLKTLLQKIIVSAVELLNADIGAIGLVDEARHAVRHQALYNLPEALFEVDFTEGVGISGQVYALKRPVIVEDYGRTVQIPINDASMREIRATLSVPIWWQGRMIGVFTIGSKLPKRAFNHHDLEVLSIFAKHVAIAIENARLYAETERLAHLDERNRIARDLHDSVTQSLFTLTLMADAVRNFVRTGHQEAGPTAELLYQTAKETLSEMRALIYQLRPAVLDDEGLIPALRKLASAIQTRHDLLVEVRQLGLCRLSKEQEEALFRIAQEALYNVVKHAQASWAAVELVLMDDEVRLEVRDNGLGLSSQTTQPNEASGGLGFATMRERAERLGGRLNINPGLEHGLQIQVQIPTR